MTPSRKFLLNAASTVILGIVTCTVIAYFQPYDEYFPPWTAILFSGFAFGVIVMPIHLVFNAILHGTNIVNINKVPVSFIIAQSVILVGSVCLVYNYVYSLPMETTAPWADGSNHKIWYYEESWLLAYSFIPLVIFTLVSGRLLHRKHHNNAKANSGS